MAYEGLTNIQLPAIPEDAPESVKEWMDSISTVIQELGTNAYQSSYHTGWINREDWTNVHMGSTTTKDTDSAVVHNLDANLSDLTVKVLVSTHGTDATSFSHLATFANYGYAVYQVDSNSLLVQTGSLGLAYTDSSGVGQAIDTEDWYYKIKVYRLI